MTSDPPTWKDVAVLQPAFVQWIVQRFGPLPDGGIVPDDYDKYVTAYREVADGTADVD